jgi:hypothetical protein
MIEGNPVAGKVSRTVVPQAQRKKLGQLKSTHGAAKGTVSSEN